MVDTVIDRRAAIEAAFEEAEKGQEQQQQAQQELPLEQPKEELKTELPKDEPKDGPPKDEPKGDLPKDEPKDELNEETPERKYSIDKAPVSWKAGPKAKWDATDPEVRNEVMRRERQMDRMMDESAGARKLAQGLHQTVAPYMARLQSFGVHPLQAIGKLLTADHVLSSANKNESATALAKIIQDYDIDIEKLDGALAALRSGKAPEEDRVERLVNERIKPLKDYVEEQRTSKARESESSIQKEIAEMEDDPQKYPFLDDVKNDMFDIAEFQARKGVYLSPKQAYTRAVAMNPELAERARGDAEIKKQREIALGKDQAAKKALSASSSVKGAPTGGPAGGDINRKDRRATIEAAFQQVEGR